MKKFVLLGLAFILPSASAASTSAFGIPWADANKTTVMQKMKAAGFVLESQEKHPKCGVTLNYGGKLLGEKAKATIIINKDGEWVGTDVRFPAARNLQGLYENIRGPLLVNYSGFQYEDRLDTLEMWKPLSENNNAEIYLSHGINDDTNRTEVRVSYSQSIRNWEGECRYYNNGL